MTAKTSANRNMFSITQVALSELRPDPRNARKHSRKQITRLMASVSAFGFTNPILIDEESNVIAGHARLAAATQLGLALVPCIRLDHLSAAEKKALAIADNQLGDMSTFDEEQLTRLLKELEDVQFDIELTGFDTGDLDRMLMAGVGEGTDPADLTGPGYAGPAVSRRGDLWQLGEHRLFCGDALEEGSYEAVLGGALAQLVITDPPFNVAIAGHVSGNGKVQHREFAMGSGEMSKPQFTRFLTTAMTHAAKFSIDGSIHYHFMDFRHAAEILEAGAAAYTSLKALCVWDKQTAGLGSLYRSQYELVFVFKSGDAPHINNISLGVFGRHRTNVWAYPGLAGFGQGRDEALASHPTVKPVALIADAIRDCSKRGGLVLDPFAGSGTILIAAERTHRRAAAIEIDPLYADVAVRRWEAYTGKAATLAADGRSFAEITASRAADIGGTPALVAAIEEVSHD